MPAKNVVLIIYTTLYREGGSQFPVVAETLTAEIKDRGFDGEIICQAVESKLDVRKAIAAVEQTGAAISEFHFVGHSGMYGPMFGTVKFPEQFSPYEWENLNIPFTADGKAFFHCCRSARWFAPFFARTFGVTSHGYFWYTTFSRSPEKYLYAGSRTDIPLYTIGCMGRKSHGLSASIKKFLGVMPAEKIKAFAPVPPSGETSYDKVAELYDDVFVDIKVRADEWKWLSEHLPPERFSVLDIGCGNGALLTELSPRLSFGRGVDESAGVVERARRRTQHIDGLEFEKIDGPRLPFPDAYFDIVISLMSFRYLDWDPLLAEIKRVTKPGGRFLIVDMVTVPVKLSEYPRFLVDKIRTLRTQRANKRFNEALQKLVSHPDWKKMLEYNPIRSEHEMKWYLESRFPGRRAETLNIGWNSRIIAFDSGPVERGVEVKLSYP